MTVSDEAVEAAAGAYFENRGDCTYRDAIRLALEAAAPFIAAQAWDEGWDTAYGETGERNPYRSDQ